MEKSGWAFAQCVYGERYHHRLCPEGQVSADQRGSFMVARALDILVCGPINETHLPADGSIPKAFSVYVATREPWPPGSVNCGNVLETARSITNT